MPGLDPGIQVFRESLDRRVKPGDDEENMPLISY